jgi:Uma2 family endonuclease
MTAEEFLAMPDDGVDRELVRGELRERPIKLRNPRHSEIVGRVAHLLSLWIDQQPKPRGRVAAGEAGFRLSRNPATFVGVDVAYVSAQTVGDPSGKPAFYEGAPVLAVEVMSASDKMEEIAEKVDLYLEAGTAVVWVLNPYFRDITVHRRGQPSRSLDASDELSGDPELPGFRVRVGDIFDF